ncbi:dihydroxyacetone kinase phosphoryl donor subunit DhaM [Georgenia deserti]|uniref:phosphoenolpyruvate--glycerone phosphotransferase n=1 Tax=Georgenia deserti TaxID=2093781 RepID=A0ABW4L9R6_9MICO
MAAVRTGLVVVSHSAKLAEGVVEVAGQMAPEVPLRPAGGTDDGGIGTSFELVDAAVTDLLAVDGIDSVVVVTDLGSATMTAESVLEMLEGAVADAVTLADGPLVEGAVAAAVSAQGGADRAAVAHAVTEAGATFGAGRTTASPEPATGADEVAQDADALAQDFVLVNEVGLHGRPAATLARLVTGFDATVTVNGVDGASVLALMALGLGKGETIHVTASGPQAAEAMDAVADSVADGFGEGVATN